MVSKTFIIALLFAISLNLTYLPAQDSGCTTRIVPAGVVDREWNFVQGLSAANFRGKFRGHDVEILSASIDASPRHIVLLLDASGSMMLPNKGWKAAKFLSDDLIRNTPPRAFIAQMAFSDSVLDTASFDQDRLALLKRLAALVKVCEQPRKTRKTALFDAISSGLSALGVSDFGNVIYVVTDAKDNKSQTQVKTVEQDLLRTVVRLFSVVITYGDEMGGRVPEEIEARTRFLSMVEATGGNVLTLPYGPASDQIPLTYIKAKRTGDRIDLALHRLYQQMGTFYRLDLRLPVPVDKPTEWKLEVIDENGRPNRRVEVHYPHRLLPCGKASADSRFPESRRLVAARPLHPSRPG
jgi:hypothetical protein